MRGPEGRNSNNRGWTRKMTRAALVMPLLAALLAATAFAPAAQAGIYAEIPLSMSMDEGKAPDSVSGMGLGYTTSFFLGFSLSSFKGEWQSSSVEYHMLGLHVVPPIPFVNLRLGLQSGAVMIEPSTIPTTSLRIEEKKASGMFIHLGFSIAIVDLHLGVHRIEAEAPIVDMYTGEQFGNVNLGTKITTLGAGISF